MSGAGLRTAHARVVPDGAPGGVPIDQVSGAVAEWVDQVGRFLGVLQVALEESRPKDDASAEVRALSGQLPALIRQCRAQVPTPEMIRIWVKSLSDEPSSQPAGAGS
jgi:hypothetical protein